MKPIVLERQAASSVCAHRGDVAAADDDPAARRLVDPGDQVQERRLAGARGPHQRDELALRDVEVEAHQDRDLDLVPAVDLFDVFDPNQRLGHAHLLLSFRRAPGRRLSIAIRPRARSGARRPAGPA